MDSEIEEIQHASLFTDADRLLHVALPNADSFLAEIWGRRGLNAKVLPLPQDVVMVTSSLTPNSLAPLTRSTLRTPYVEVPNAPRFLAANSS